MSSEHAIGQLEGRMTGAEFRLASLESRLSPIEDTIARSKGGWRILTLLGALLLAALSAFGQALLTAIQH